VKLQSKHPTGFEDQRKCGETAAACIEGHRVDRQENIEGIVGYRHKS
jgi:hypothetical protein